MYFNYALKLMRDHYESNGVCSVYLSDSIDDYLISDIDILVFHDLCFNHKLFIDNLKHSLHSESTKEVYIRFSSNGFFKLINNPLYDEKPIILDILLLCTTGSVVNQIGFENNILINLLLKSTLIYGPHLKDYTKKDCDKTFLETYIHYFQNNISNLIDLFSSGLSPFEIYLNSLKIFFLALNKFYCFEQWPRKVYRFNKTAILIELLTKLPHLQDDIKFIETSLRMSRSDIDLNISQKIMKTSLKLTNHIFKFIVKKG